MIHKNLKSIQVCFKVALFSNIGSKMNITSDAQTKSPPQFPMMAIRWIRGMNYMQRIPAPPSPLCKRSVTVWLFRLAARVTDHPSIITIWLRYIKYQWYVQRKTPGRKSRGDQFSTWGLSLAVGDVTC